MAKRGKIPTRSDWERVTWGRPANEIADEMGVGTPLVYVWAKRLGREVLAVKRGPAPIDWPLVDWTSTNVEIARGLGVSAEWTGKMRRRFETVESS